MALSGTSILKSVDNKTIAVVPFIYNATSQSFTPESNTTVYLVSGNSNPVPSTTISNTTVSGALSGIILAANPNRKTFTVQNLNNAILYVKYGHSVTASSFTQILKAGSAADDGNGGILTDSVWKGVVTASGVASARYMVYELV